MSYSTYKLGGKYYLYNKVTDQVIFDIGGSYNHIQSLADHFNKTEVTKWRKNKTFNSTICYKC